MMISTMLFMVTLAGSLITSSPLPLAALVVSAAAMAGLTAGLTLSSWFMVAILLIFLGGMMVMFLYMCTLAMNEKLFIKKIKMNWMVPPIIVLMMTQLPRQKMNHNLDIPSLYQPLWSIVILFLIAYLLASLLIVVKVVQNFKGAVSKSWF